MKIGLGLVIQLCCATFC